MKSLPVISVSLQKNSTLLNEKAPVSRGLPVYVTNVKNVINVPDYSWCLISEAVIPLFAPAMIPLPLQPK